MNFHIQSASIRQKLIALGKFEILRNWLENELKWHFAEISEQNFDGLART